jgi:hypothetical protein
LGDSSLRMAMSARRELYSRVQGASDGAVRGLLAGRSPGGEGAVGPPYRTIVKLSGLGFDRALPLLAVAVSL